MRQLFYPNIYLTSLDYLDTSILKKRGIKAILFDLDNTIVPRDSHYLEPEVEEWLQGLLKQGFSLAIVSNNGSKRVNLFADRLGIPTVSRAVKPFKKAFQRALELLDVKAENAAVLGDQVFTDILGGNRLGLFTILVVPMKGKEFWATRMFNRRMERLVLRDINRRFHGKSGCFILDK